jgi:signal transduction histidine kinase
MTAVIGIADVLLRTPLSSEQSEFVRTMREAALHLLDLLNDILALSKIEAEKLALLNTDFDLGQLLDSVVATFSLAAREKGIDLGLRRAPDVPLRLRGDARRLRQILVNLVGNAVKFTARGEVTVTVDSPPRAVRDDADVTLRFTVRDTGIGIPPERLPHIFEDFTQAHPDQGEKYGGTGLGLTISRHLARLRGDIQVSSREGAAAAPAPRPSPRPAPKAPRARPRRPMRTGRTPSPRPARAPGEKSFWWRTTRST